VLLSFLATLRYLLLLRLAKASVLFLAYTVEDREHALEINNQLVNYLTLSVRLGSFAVGSSAQAEAVQLAYAVLGVSD
jgi:hypothetical protein